MLPTLNWPIVDQYKNLYRLCVDNVYTVHQKKFYEIQNAPSSNRYLVIVVTVDALLFLRNCNLPLCRVIVSVGDYLLNNVRGSPCPFVGSLYNRYCL